MLLGVDVGGTFTDAVLFDGERVHTAKPPTTPDDQSVAVIGAVEAVLRAAGAEPGDVEPFAHGMTVGTNALLEERGARTALIATGGFTDLLEIGRQDRPELYRLCAAKPAPLVAPELRFEAAERVGPTGVVEPLGDGEPQRLTDLVRESGAESVAVCLLFSYLDPAHERRIAEHLRRELPGVHVSASHEVLPRFREYERCSTTTIDAYLSPLLGRYLARLGEAAAVAGLPEPLVMQSSGGVAVAAEAARAGAWSVLSGPAGGAVGAGLLARACGDGNVLGLDMGGTSCDVCVVEDGEVRRTDSRRDRRPADPAADGRRPHGRRRRRLDRLARPRRRAARRAALGGRRPRARLLRARRHRADRDRRQPAARLPGDRLDPRRRRRPRRRGGPSRRRRPRPFARPLRTGDRRGDRAGRQPGDGAGAARRHRRARRRPARLRAAPLRRRRSDARRRDRRRARHRPHPLPARRRRPLGARPLRLGPPPRHRPAP